MPIIQNKKIHAITFCLTGYFYIGELERAGEQTIFETCKKKYSLTKTFVCLFPYYLLLFYQVIS